MAEQTETRALTKADKISAVLKHEKSISSFIEALGNERTAKRYISSVMVAVINNTDLQECTPKSIFNCALRAATLSLSCDPAYGQAWLVPYKNKKTGERVATFITGYKGYKQMAMRTGKYKIINDGVVYDGQIVEENQLTGEIKIVGTPTQPRTIKGYFLYFQLRDGFEKSFYMSVEEIKEHGERYSPSYNWSTSPWKTNFDEMARKTVIRLGLSKHGYFSDEDVLEMSIVEDGEDNLDWEEEAIEEKANQKPESTEKIMADLGFGSSEPVQDGIFEDVKEEETKKSDATINLEKELNMTLDEAKRYKSIDGLEYGEMTSADLRDIEAGITDVLAKNKKLSVEKTNELKNKQSAIKLILTSRI